MQPIEEIEKAYETPDPWQYKTNPYDIFRREVLRMISTLYGPYERCLDIGAGEGWITSIYPAAELYGYEVSNNAARRFPPNVARMEDHDLFEGLKFDLVTANGVLYGHYTIKRFLEIIKKHAGKHLLVSSVEAWEDHRVKFLGKEIFSARFPYRPDVGHQRVTLIEVNK